MGQDLPNSMNRDVLKQVTDLYDRIDEQTAALQGATGLHCPPGCGKCCENPEVETTVLEMLPLALELWRRGEASAWLDRVAQVNECDPCVFYSPDPFIPGNGRCSVYPWRPSLCRLFAFATVNDKQGTPQLAACVRHKATIPEEVDRAKSAIAAGLDAANFSHVSTQIANLDPSLGIERFPINQALKLALQRVGLIAQLTLGDGDGDRVA
jgi:Fe-S-cluster containining protein